MLDVLQMSDMLTYQQKMPDCLEDEEIPDPFERASDAQMKVEEIKNAVL